MELMAAYVANLREFEQLAALPAEAQLRLLISMGSQACSLNLLEEARNYLKQALELATRLNDVERELSCRLRLGVTLQYLDRHEQADAMFQQALKMTLNPGLDVYQDTILQHWGKMLAEQGKYAPARKCFEQALLLRQAKQDPQLIEDTEDALELIDSLGEVTPEGYLVTRTQITQIEVPEPEEEEA